MTDEEKSIKALVESGTLNTINFTRIKYGGVLVKRVFVNNDITLQVPEWKNLITDQVDIKNGFKIEKHYLTPIDIQNKEDVWEGIAENKDLIEKIIKSNDKDNNRICILEVEAQFPDNVIDGESEKYTLQKHIILTDKEEQPVAVLHQERLKTSQYKYISWLEASGRGLGIGIVEEGFEAQIATNDVVMKEIEKYSKEYFRQQGKIGLKKYLRTTTKKQRSERAKKAWETKRSYPQE
jgi:hypothetical protein